MTVIAEYKNAAAQVPDEALLGNILWYTISDADVNYEQAKKELEARNLDASLLRPIRSVDAFKLATNELKHSFKPEDGVKLNVLVRSVGQDGDTSHRHIILERVSTKPGQKRRLIYDSSAEIVYSRGAKNKEGERVNDGIQVSRRQVPGLTLTPEQEAWLDNALTNLVPRFEHFKTHLQSHKVRNFVREYAYTLGGVCVKEGGGVYFVFQKRKDELLKLREWVESIGSEFSITPLLDIMDKRKEIAVAFEEEAIAECERMEREIEKILTDPQRTIKEGTFDDYGRGVAELTQKAIDFRDNLGVRGDLAGAHIEKLKKQVMALVDRIDYGRATA